MSLKDRLRAARVTSGLTRQQLAEKTNLGVRHIAFLEDGVRTNVTTDTATALATALGVTLDWLLLGKGDAPMEKRVAPTGSDK